MIPREQVTGEEAAARPGPLERSGPLMRIRDERKRKWLLMAIEIFAILIAYALIIGMILFAAPLFD